MYWQTQDQGGCSLDSLWNEYMWSSILKVHVASFSQLYIMSLNIFCFISFILRSTAVSPMGILGNEASPKGQSFYVENSHKRPCLRLLCNRNTMWTTYIFIFSRKDSKTEKKDQVKLILKYIHLTQYNQILAFSHVINTKTINEIFCILYMC